MFTPHCFTCHLIGEVCFHQSLCCFSTPEQLLNRASGNWKDHSFFRNSCACFFSCRFLRIVLITYHIKKNYPLTHLGICKLTCIVGNSHGHRQIKKIGNYWNTLVLIRHYDLKRCGTPSKNIHRTHKQLRKLTKIKMSFLHHFLCFVYPQDLRGCLKRSLTDRWPGSGAPSSCRVQWTGTLPPSSCGPKTGATSTAAGSVSVSSAWA